MAGKISGERTGKVETQEEERVSRLAGFKFLNLNF